MATFALGDRVYLGNVKQVATLRFFGQTKFAEGEWYGVELDEPNGKNNGSVQGISYFSCPEKRGLFVKAVDRLPDSPGPKSPDTASLKIPDAAGQATRSSVNGGVRKSTVTKKAVVKETRDEVASQEKPTQSDSRASVQHSASRDAKQAQDPVRASTAKAKAPVSPTKDPDRIPAAQEEGAQRKLSAAELLKAQDKADSLNASITRLSKLVEELESRVTSALGGTKAEGSASSTAAKVTPFYSDEPSSKLHAFSNFFRHSPPYEYVLPSFARRNGFPSAMRCSFSEKAIMAVKAALMGDLETWYAIDKADDPASVKALGRQIKNFDIKLWEEHLLDIAFDVVQQKFEADENCRQLLLSTGDAIIAYNGASNDCIWGIGLPTNDDRVYHPDQWLGRNVLGSALMKVREHIRAKAAERVQVQGLYDQIWTKVEETLEVKLSRAVSKIVEDQSSVQPSKEPSSVHRETLDTLLEAHTAGRLVAAIDEAFVGRVDPGVELLRSRAAKILAEGQRSGLLRSFCNEKSEVSEELSVVNKDSKVSPVVREPPRAGIRKSLRQQTQRQLDTSRIDAPGEGSQKSLRRPTQRQLDTSRIDAPGEVCQFCDGTGKLTGDKQAYCNCIAGEAAHMAKVHSTLRWGKPLDEIRQTLRDCPTSNDLNSVLMKADAKTGNQALHIAAQNCHLELVRFVLDHEVDPTPQNKAGHTPLHMSVEYDGYFVTKLLLERGADPKRTNAEGHEAILGMAGTKTGNEAWDHPLFILKAADNKDRLQFAMDELEKADTTTLDKSELAKVGMQKAKDFKTEWDKPRFMSLMKKL